MSDQEQPTESGPGAGNQLFTVVYSYGRDLYRVAPLDATTQMWLSVAKFGLPMPAPSVPRLPYLGTIRCGSGWRKGYSVDWSVIQPGLTVTLPASDELVADYAGVVLPTAPD